jgi:hypothetical protein
MKNLANKFHGNTAIGPSRSISSLHDTQCRASANVAVFYSDDRNQPVLVMQLDALRRDIEYRRRQIYRQRREILQLQKLGIPSASAEALLQRMLDKVDELSAERDRLWAEAKVCYRGTKKQIRGAQRR